ncbi:DUF4249 domain-containing protein [Hymenobacter chitinivorans]|uniref:Uncharacterized protein DUF4249 n=1 Tax=Hymenobacter chitinivorans DSM 11115 TaxID=1121954 RepID=A0A2M9BLN9_9BACT|nr:DUF4249 domain-containing protein [Hymenobacter chitinivorans]PJJ58830.1 uncharacterized protein DUF4249 [Hymenobacter chitinivorans DSM 11115]
MWIICKPFALLLTGSLALLLAGCIDQIDADLPEPPKKLVVNSILTPDSVVRVQVSRVTSPLDSSARVLTGAKVYLLVPGQVAVPLSSQGKGLYSLPTAPTSQTAYTLQAELDGYPPVQASDTIPARVPIDEAWYSFPTGTDRNNELLGTIVVRFTDPAAQTNFYELSCYQENQGVLLDVRGNAAVTAEDDKEYEPQSLVFSDRLFNGQAFELRASFLTHGHSGGGSSPPTTRDPLLVLRTVSRAYYQYRKSWTRHLYNQGTKGDTYNLNQLLFLGDPSTMYSNVAGGYGVVVGYSQQTMRLLPR